MDGGTPEVRALAGRLIDRETALCVAPPPAVATAVIELLYEERGEDPTVGGRDATGDGGGDATDGGWNATNGGRDPTSDEGGRRDDTTSGDATNGGRGATSDEGGRRDDATGTPDGGRVTRPPTEDAAVRLLVPDDERESVFTAFGRTAEAAELIERDALAVRTIDTVTQRVTLTEERAYAHVRAGEEVRSLAAEDDSFRSSVRETYERQWTASRPAEVPAPARARLLRTFADRFPDAAETLATVLSADPPIPRDGRLDPVTVITLVGARHRLQTLKLSEWAEALSFSSRTELSRVTNRLEDHGLIATERVPHGVGRPRQRLDVARDALADCPPAELLPVARREYHDGE